MKIIELDIANIRVIKFNENGLNIIKTKKTFTDNIKDKRSVNGSGKSLVIAFIHYCFGGSRKLAKSLEAYAEYISYVKLTILHKNQKYILERKPSNNFILIDGKQVFIKSSNSKKESIINWLFKKKFFTPHVDFSSYSLLKRFIRDGVAYSKYKLCGDGESDRDDDIQKYISYLLGLDYEGVCRKIEIKDEIKILKTIIDQLKKEGNGISVANRGQIVTDIEKLKKDLENIKIAENYSDIQKDADKIKSILQDKRNEKSKIEYSLQDITNSLLTKKDLDLEQVKKLFAEIQLIMPENIIKRFEDVERFNKALIDDRNNILTQERKSLNKLLNKVQGEISILEIELDNQLKFLKTHHAIDEYIAIINKKNSLETELKEIEFNKKSLMTNQSKISHQESKLQEENEKTISFLESIDNTIIMKAEAKFCTIVHQMYDDNRPASLKIENNNGDNKTRYNIDVKIDNNTKGGVNHVTIFCWDWLLLLLKNNHHIDFIFHDSNIFEGVDARQIDAMINFAKENSEVNSSQYICSINYDQYSECSDDVKKLLLDKKNIILELTDLNDEGKLLKKKLDDLDY